MSLIFEKVWRGSHSLRGGRSAPRNVRVQLDSSTRAEQATSPLVESAWFSGDLKELREQNLRLEWLLAEAELEKDVLREIACGRRKACRLPVSKRGEQRRSVAPGSPCRAHMLCSSTESPPAATASPLMRPITLKVDGEQPPGPNAGRRSAQQAPMMGR